MKSHQKGFPSAEALELKAQFEHWRNTTRKRSRIPTELWSAAIELTNHYSASQIAKLLRLNLSDFKKKISSVSNPVSVEKPPLSFVEFPNISSYKFEGCEISVKRADGSQMHMRLSNTSGADMSAFIQAFVQ